MKIQKQRCIHILIARLWNMVGDGEYRLDLELEQDIVSIEL